MSATTAPPNIDGLSGDELDQAVADAGIDATTGGSKQDGGLTAAEKREALRCHYDTAAGDGDASPDAAAPDGAADDTDVPQDPDSADTEPGTAVPQLGPESASEENPNAPDPPPTPSTDELRERQLEAGKVSGELAAAVEQRADWTPAEHRVGAAGARPIDGRIDNMTRRGDSDVLEGHFCLIDFGDDEHGDGAREAVERVVGEGNAHLGAADYGVYVGPGELDETGYPLTATVLLRDEHAAQVSGVPYGALRPAQAGRR